MQDILKIRDTRPQWAFTLLVLSLLTFVCVAKAVEIPQLKFDVSRSNPCDRYAAQKAGHDKLLAEKGLLVSTAAAPDFFFVLQPGDSQSRFITEKQLRMPNVSGLTIRLRLAWLERADGSYDVTFLNECVKRCHNTGDCYTLLVMGGESSQPWLPQNLNRYKKAAFMLSSYASDPLCVGVHVGCGVSPPGVSEEQHWKPAMPRPAIDAAKALIDVWATYFPNQAKLFAIGLPDAKAMNEIINYGIARCPGKFLVKGNALKASPFALTFPQHQLVVSAGQRGALIGWECVGSTKEARFGGSFAQAYANARTMANAAGKPISYLAPYQPDIPALGGLR